ncbi:MAG: hypothetical protein M3Z66_22615 [Chloroflexota bacterium]|nr:hypothetical protein [Chloroflexota bacterium]
MTKKRLRRRSQKALAQPAIALILSLLVSFAAGTSGANVCSAFQLPTVSTRGASPVSSAAVTTGLVADHRAVPTAPNRSILLNETVRASGWKIILERVVVTPAGTLVALRGAGPDADAELRAGGKVYPLYQPGGDFGAQVKECFARHRRCPGLWQSRQIDYVATAMKRAGRDGRGLAEDTAETAKWIRQLQRSRGEWTLTIRPNRTHTNPIFQLYGGPWVFHFAVR